MLLTAYSILVTIGWIGATIYLLVNSRKIAYLKDVGLATGFTEPEVAVIIAVKDEEADVEQALTSVCRLNYTNYRILVVNDRSVDGTPGILDKIASANSRVTVVAIAELPDHWLGKNHALYQGYLRSAEEWLLFTDADVLYSSDALKKAVCYAIANNLDHLTALPEITSKSSVFKSVMNTFAIMLELRLRPWNAANPASKAFIGVGAFNLVKRSAYEKAGTHKPISLRPDDDLKLGENIKKAGLRQGVVYGDKEISLAWYNNLGEFINGLMKNMFSAANYQVTVAIAMAFMTFIVFVLPVPLLLLTTKTMVLGALIFLSQTVLMMYKRGAHGRWWHALVIPFAGLVMMYIIIRSTYKTLRQGGIYWRNSFYSLEELRTQK